MSKILAIYFFELYLLLMNTQPTVFNRFLSIWKPDFFKEVLLKEKSSTPTWKFWFLWNSLLAVIATVFISLVVFSVWEKVEQEFIPSLEDFEIEMKDGQLTTTFSEPLLWEDEGFIVALDTQGIEYDESVLHEYQEGFFITGDKLVVKDGATGDYEVLPYSDFDAHFTLSKTTIVTWLNENHGFIKTVIISVVFFLLWFFLNILRLVTALWWAFLFWIVGRLAGIKKFDFRTSYFAVLNLYFIPLILEGLLLINGVFIPFGTTILFGILFGMNFWTLKQK